MKHILRVFSATAALVLLSSAAHAIVVVQSFTQEMQDIGLNKTGYGEAPDAQITAFDNGLGAHEVTGSILFTAQEGQEGGLSFSLLTGGDLCDASGFANFDNGDWDIPERLFGCQDIVAGGCDASLYGNPSGNLVNSTGFVNTGTACDIAPDLTGRLDSATCSDLYAAVPGDPDVSYTWLNMTPSYACALPQDAKREYEFFNYMACNPTQDCFQVNPAAYANLDGSQADCDMGDQGPFDGQLLATQPNDVWIAGTVMNLRLPLGTRLGNTVYPGTMLNGEGQYGYNDVAYSPRKGKIGSWQIPFDGEMAWPAVVYEFEANHLTPINGVGVTPDCSPTADAVFGITWDGALCRAHEEGYDKIAIFVPDLLNSAITNRTGGSQAIFQIGESLIDMANMKPADRDEVANCYRDEICTDGAGISAIPCDYDTRICVDIRGAYLSMRPGQIEENRRFFRVNPELPQNSPVDFSPPNNWLLGVMISRIGTKVPSGTSAPESFPSCDGYNFCYVLDNDGDGAVGPGDEEYPDPADSTPVRFLHVPWASVGSVTISEPNPGFIRVLSTLDPNLRTTLTCELTKPTGVDLVYSDTTMTIDSANGMCPIVTAPTATPIGNVDVVDISTPLSGMTGFWPADGGVIPADLGPYAGDLGGVDSIVYQIATESSGSSAILRLHGLELLIADNATALPGGMGCVELDCTLRFPGEECTNHENVANEDTTANLYGKTATQHMPGSGGVFGPPDYFNDLPIACIVPGKTTLLYPYMVKALGYDTGIVITNTSGTHAIAHFYLYQEEGPITNVLGTANVGTNPLAAVLMAKDPERLSKTNSPCFTTPPSGTPCPQTYYDKYNELPPYGQYVNMVFAIESDPLTPKNDWSAGQNMPPSTGIFGANVLRLLTSDPDGNAATDDGRVWMYVVVQQCYSHGYQMVFSDGGFGSTLALVDNDTTITPVDGNLVAQPRLADGSTSGQYFVPFHQAPSRFINPGGGAADIETRRYRFWNGNDE